MRKLFQPPSGVVVITMDSAAIIPIKSHSSRLPEKNFRDFDGKPLYEHFFQKLYPNNPFDTVFVDTDSEEVKTKADEYGFEVIDRPDYLTKDDANGNDLLVYESGVVEVDVYFQLFVTAPLIKPQSIKKAYDRLMEGEDCDSVFTVTEENSFFWYEGEPVNYDPRELPRTQDLVPVVEETTGLYGIEASALDSRECRIGYEPAMVPVSDYEGIDIDNKSDLVIARAIYEEEMK